MGASPSACGTSSTGTTAIDRRSARTTRIASAPTPVTRMPVTITRRSSDVAATNAPAAGRAAVAPTPTEGWKTSRRTRPAQCAERAWPACSPGRPAPASQPGPMSADTQRARSGRVVSHRPAGRIPPVDRSIIRTDEQTPVEVVAQGQDLDAEPAPVLAGLAVPSDVKGSMTRRGKSRRRTRRDPVEWSTLPYRRSSMTVYGHRRTGVAMSTSPGGPDKA